MSILFSPQGSQANSIHNVAIFGDSLADGIWAGLYSEIKTNPDFKLYRDSKVGEGLTRPDFSAFANLFISSLNADHITDVVIMFGANDDEGLRDHKDNSYAFESPGWISAYQRRMNMIISTCQKHGVRVIWVGLPVMRDENRNRDANSLNVILQKTVLADGAIFLSIEDEFKGTDGNFALYLPNPNKQLRQVRAPDGTHFTFYGYDLLAKQVIAIIEEQQPASLPITNVSAPGSNMTSATTLTSGASTPTTTTLPAVPITTLTSTQMLSK